MIKIAFVIDTIESPTAGTEKQLLLLIEHLDRTQFQPYLCVLRSSAWLETEFALCPLHILGITSFKRLQTLERIYAFSRFLRREGIAIVQPHFRDAGIAAILAAKLGGVPCIIGTRRNQGYWLTPFELRLQKFLNRWVSAFIANSRNTKEWAVKTEGIPAEKITVIYNAIDLGAFARITEEDRQGVRRRWGIPEDAPVVGIVANLRPVKGIDVFLRAAAIVSRRVPVARFVIVGAGDERQRLEALTVDLGVQDAVRFTGTRTDTALLVSSFDVGVLSSHSESFSNAVVEYLAAGIPVVSTDVGGCREALDTESDRIVPPGDWEVLAAAICDVLERKNGRKRSAWVVDNCTVKGVMKQVEEVYAGWRPGEETRYG